MDQSSFHHAVCTPLRNPYFSSPRPLEQLSSALPCTPILEKTREIADLETFALHIYNSTETRGFCSAVSDQNTSIIMGAELMVLVVGHVDVDGDMRETYQSLLQDLLTGTLGHYLNYHNQGQGHGQGKHQHQGQGQDQLLLLSILEDFIERNYDFGTAYALLRPVWGTENPSSIQDELRRREGNDRERRQNALVGNRIVYPHLGPRRIWDLYSNRVVPSWITYKKQTPISHAWVDEKDRVDVRTPINGKEWPVPIPKDVDLNLIRIEMLNVGAEYAWLDVLCLRQKEEGGPREDLRVEEWRLDVPTIGRVYSGPRTVVIYLSGLGRPFRLKDGDLDSNQNWFRRAWTLQEVGYKCIIAGDMPDGPMHTQPIDGRNYETVLLTRFHKKLNSMKRDVHHIFALLADMQKRVSTNPVDRVAGLAFPLRPSMIPAYYESETLEDAWTALVNTMHPQMRMSFLIVYPEVGLGCKKWRPTWDQVMMEPLPKDVSDFTTSVQLDTSVQHDNETDEDWFNGHCIEKGHVRVFDMGSAGGHDRCGELVVKATDGIVHTFKIHVTHRFPIPEDTYMLLCGTLHLHQLLPLLEKRLVLWWAIGRRLPDQRFEKVSVIVMDDLDEEDRQKLKDLIPVVKSHNVLV
ncbi:hypothetical protein ARMGADRAFT_1068618 [Armillaria gallica]|uniref:Heterokaryon incompatibility domain-containing protein n=1 Tax=Armillaria gallica TaxID=47427 RepID=A0A2H3CS70_ARMGA|nr:hypothetical protein ARMGADRAFT_1068618 [Armillaria gallica]